MEFEKILKDIENILPLKIGSEIYQIEKNYKRCSRYHDVYDDYRCSGCEFPCDYQEFHTPTKYKISSIQQIVGYIERKEIGTIVFTTEEEAISKIKELYPNEMNPLQTI